MNTQNRREGSLEQALADQLRHLLGRIPWLAGVRIETHPAHFNRAFDLLARFTVPRGSEIQLWVDCRPEPRPSQFPYVAIEREFAAGAPKRARVPVFAAPHISPRMAEMCERHGWSWYDLAGNCRITVPGLFHLEHRGLPAVHQPPRPVANLGTPEAGRIVRALLQPNNGGMRWTQREMQNHCRPSVSLGLVNKVTRHLRDEAFIAKSPEGGFTLLEPLKLLFAWRDAYRFGRHERHAFFCLLQGKKLRDALCQFGSDAEGIAYASFSAAEFQAPHVRQPKTWLYVRQQRLSAFEERLGAKPVESGENLVVLIPQDAGVFHLTDAGDPDEMRLPCTSAVQTYVDLCHSGGRGQEAAEALLEQRLKPDWKLKGLRA